MTPFLWPSVVRRRRPTEDRWTSRCISWEARRRRRTGVQGDASATPLASNVDGGAKQNQVGVTNLGEQLIIRRHCRQSVDCRQWNCWSGQAVRDLLQERRLVLN